jgi:hypothetical protein
MPPLSLSSSLNLKVKNPDLDVPNGIQLTCYGPFAVPSGARSLRTFMPQVDMSIVHHMIMFGGSGGGPGFFSKPGVTNHCYRVRSHRTRSSHCLPSPWAYFTEHCVCCANAC